MPDQATMDEQGMKGFQMVVWHGVYAPKGTPAAVIDKLNGAVRAGLNNAAFQARMKDLGADVVPEAKRTPQGLKTWLQAETERLGGVIRSAGTYAD
jgi:tripartite-type tricarboxylate transporter receptor subunit TctC